MCKISIITALHNKEPYIQDTIDSVRRQTLSDWQWVIVENRSSDNGPEIAKEASAIDGRIQLLDASEHVAGPGQARNFGLKHAGGEWILFLDADDLIDATHLVDLVAPSRQCPDAEIIAGGWREFFGSEDSQAQPHRPSTWGSQQKVLINRAFSLAPWILHAAIVKRRIFEHGLRWPTHIDPYPDEDTVFWFAAVLRGTVAWSDSFGALYRRATPGNRSDSGSLRSRLLGYEKIIRENLLEAEKMECRLSADSAYYTMLMYETSYRNALSKGDFDAANMALRLARPWLKQAPWSSCRSGFRKIFGLRRFNQLRALAKPSANKVQKTI